MCVVCAACVSMSGEGVHFVTMSVCVVSGVRCNLPGVCLYKCC